MASISITAIFSVFSVFIAKSTFAQSEFQPVFSSTNPGESAEWGGGSCSFSRDLPPPRGENGGPVIVYLGFNVESLGKFDNLDMTFDIDNYVELSWIDPRLRHNETVKLISTHEKLSQIWLPKLYFANAPIARFHDVLTRNFAFYIEPDSTVTYSVRVFKRVSCQFELYEYPMDHQSCDIKIHSCKGDAQIYMKTAYKSSDTPNNSVVFKWFPNHAIDHNQDIRLPEFDILGIGTCYCNGTYRYRKSHKGHHHGTFSCLVATLYLKRQLTYHLVQTYIPTGMIVVISWVSFWIDRNAALDRISLSVTMLLTLSTMIAGVRFVLPPVSYAKAIDYWLGTCMTFVLAELLQFAVVNSLMRKAQKSEKGSQKTTDKANENHAKTQNYTAKALLLDKSCRLLFPLLFLSYNLLYWFYYLDVVAVSQEDYVINKYHHKCGHY